MKLFIVRHGKTEFNNENKMQGWSDSPLLESSISEAKALGEAFKAESITFDKVYTSDLKRTVDTAKAILDGLELDLEVNQNTNLREINFGSAETQDVNHVWDIVARANNYDDMQHLLSNVGVSERCDLLHKVDEFSDAETSETFNQRTLEGIKQVASENNEGDNVLIVIHGLTILSLINQLGGNSNANRSFDNLSVSEISFKDNQFEVVDINKMYI